LPLPDRTAILIVGAGVTGLTAARALVAAGREVLVLDKGFNPGGRMATRRLGEASLDHGTTFLTAAGGKFTEAIGTWADAGAAAPWQGIELGQTHWRGLPDMRGLAGHLARDLPVRTRTRLVSVGPAGNGWSAVSEEGGVVAAGAVLMTPPVPQALELLNAGGTELDPGLGAKLSRLDYAMCLTVLAVLDDPAHLPDPGLLEPAAGPIARLVDEQAKGNSPVPAVTIHATPEFSRERWDQDSDEWAAALVAAADPWLGSSVKEYQVHRWKFSRPVRIWPEPCLVAVARPPLVLAGDAFGGPDVPGAYRSGLAAAEVLAGLVVP
jgi:predicted NAD/FAD-dependent oxidoreductase